MICIKKIRAITKYWQLFLYVFFVYLRCVDRPTQSLFNNKYTPNVNLFSKLTKFMPEKSFSGFRMPCQVWSWQLAVCSWHFTLGGILNKRRWVMSVECWVMSVERWAVSDERRGMRDEGCLTPHYSPLPSHISYLTSHISNLTSHFSHLISS